MISEALRLMAAVLSLYGDGASDWSTVRPSDAARASLAITVTRGDWPAELVATIAVRESSMRWMVNPRSGACSPGQILVSHDKARQARFCARLRRRGEVAWYRAITRKLDAARDVCERLHRRDAVACAVAGYVGGMPAVRLGRRRVARAILRRADRLHIATLVGSVGA